jgi:O-glycosyl hydrolase
MEYWYQNNLSPYYSEAYADITDLGINDHNWLGVIGADALVLRFHVEPNNPFTQQMYVKLTDGDSPAKTATVMYNNTTNVRLQQWNQWSIALTAFADVNLANVTRITIGFGNGSPGDANVVYFDDITLGAEIEELPGTTGEVNINTVYQQLEGFGGAICYDAYTMANHPSREAVYDLLFKDLGLDLLRIKNEYQISSSDLIATGQIVTEARQPTRNPNLKLFLVPWSPPAYLKNTGDLGTLNGTLAKDANGHYMYADYATWWLNSLTGSGGWNSVGVYPDYISIQNEPDWGQQDQECRFDSTEDSSYAGYDQAFSAVFNEFNGNVSPMPKLLAPETMGFGNSQAYINALLYESQTGNVYGFSHHLYSDGSYNDPDGMISGMINYHALNNYKPLFMTEYGADGTPTFAQAVLLAQHIYNCLVFEGVTSYYTWSLIRDGSYTTGGMINLTPGGGYIIRDLYWFFKAYSYFTDPGWYRVDASTSLGSQGNLRMTAFKSPDSNQLTVVILNISTTDIDLMLTLNGFAPSGSEIYRSSATENWVYLGPYSPAMTMPAQSITTIHLTGTALSDCAAVWAAGYGLTSDLNGDCYVDYEDLKIIADNWLRTDCTAPDNCGGADFGPTDGVVNFLDFSTLAEQWLWCNNPQDPNCTPNWYW